MISGKGWVFGPRTMENLRLAERMGLLNLRGDSYKFTPYGIRFGYVLGGLQNAQSDGKTVSYLELVQSIFSITKMLDDITSFFSGFFTGNPFMPSVPSPLDISVLMEKAASHNLVKIS